MRREDVGGGAVGLPALHVEQGEGFERGLPREELEATLRVLDSPHTEEPDQEVEAVHQEGTKHGPLRREGKTLAIDLRVEDISSRSKSGIRHK